MAAELPCELVWLRAVSPSPRDLPVPLLTREHLPAFASIADIEDLKEQVRTLNLLILLLPDLHQRVLKVRAYTPLRQPRA